MLRVSQIIIRSFLEGLINNQELIRSLFYRKLPICVYRLLCKVSHPSSDSSLSMLHSLVAPVIVLAASI